MTSLVEKHYVQDGEDYFVTKMSTENLLHAISVSSNGDIQMLGRRIAEQADEIERLQSQNKRMRNWIESWLSSESEALAVGWTPAENAQQLLKDLDGEGQGS